MPFANFSAARTGMNLNDCAKDDLIALMAGCSKMLDCCSTFATVQNPELIKS